MKLSALVTIAAVIGGSFLIPNPAEAAQKVKWINSLNTSSADGPALYIGKCSNWLIAEACPEGKPIQGQLKVGSSVNGMKIGAIRCEYQSKTLKGWPGGPRHVAIKGTYNCKAAPSRWHTQQTDVRPWVIVTAVSL